MIYRCIALLFAAFALAPTPIALAHEGHDDAPGTSSPSAGSTLVVQVSKEARANLDLQLAEAEIRPMEATLSVIGEIAPLPRRVGAVTSRIAGRVTWIGVAEGDRVRKGEPVVEVESLQLGDPPPRVRYAAPLSGRVIDRHVGPGDSVEPNAHLIEVADLAEVLAVGQLFENQISRVEIGQIVRVRVPSFSDEVFQGVVERIGGALDPNSRALPLYVRLRGTRGKLLPRMPAALSVVVATSDAALSIPSSALLGDFGNQFVFVEQDAERGLFRRVSVERGLDDDQFIEIVEGLLPGDRVVTVGNYSLQFLPPFLEADAHEVPAPASSTDASADESTTSASRLMRVGGVLVAGIGIATLTFRGLRRLRAGV